MSATNHKTTVLFLCTGNSCRSQMAEGWTRHLHGDVFAPSSTGVAKHGLNPYAVILKAYRTVRDQIRLFIQSLPKTIEETLFSS